MNCTHTQIFPITHNIYLEEHKVTNVYKHSSTLWSVNTHTNSIVLTRLPFTNNTCHSLANAPISIQKKGKHTNANT